MKKKVILRYSFLNNKKDYSLLPRIIYYLEHCVDYHIIMRSHIYTEINILGQYTSLFIHCSTIKDSRILKETIEEVIDNEISISEL